MSKTSNGKAKRQLRVQRMVGPIPREQLKAAMMKDFEQRCIDSMTPDRGYGFPMDNVEAVISKYWPNDPSSATAALGGNKCNQSGPPPFAAAHG